MPVSRREVCRVAGSAVALAAVSPVAGALAAELRVVSVELPDTIEEGGTFTASVTLENVGDESITTEVQYEFEGDLIASMEVTLEPGDERTATLPNMEYAWLERDNDVSPGRTYTHSIGARSAREAAEVEIVSGDGTAAGESTPPPEGSSPPLELVSPRLPGTLERGEPAFVGAVVENVQSSPVTIDITYRFEEQLVFEKDGVRIPAGERKKIGFPELTVSAIEESFGERLPPGTYNHSFGMPDGPRVQEAVEIVGSGGGTAPPVEIGSVELPEEIRAGEPFSVGMTVTNRGDRPVERGPTYAFDGQRVLSGAPPDSLPIEPGATEQFRFGEVTLRMIEQSLPEPVEPGEHEHSIGFPDGPREGTAVVVRAGDGESGGGAEPAPEAGRQRGFFSNSGDEPAFLSNPFNLTTLGFLLSVAGIAHQMLGGR